MEQFNDFDEATPDEVRKFLEHAFDVFDSDKPEDTHVVIPAGVSVYVAQYLSCAERAYAGSDACPSDLLPERLHAYAEKFRPGKLTLSELAALAILAYQFRQALVGNIQWQMCIPKYLLEALFHALIAPGHAVLADDFIYLQDYQ